MSAFLGAGAAPRAAGADGSRAGAPLPETARDRFAAALAALLGGVLEGGEAGRDGGEPAARTHGEVAVDGDPEGAEGTGAIRSGEPEGEDADQAPAAPGAGPRGPGWTPPSTSGEHAEAHGSPGGVEAPRATPSRPGEEDGPAGPGRETGAPASVAAAEPLPDVHTHGTAGAAEVHRVPADPGLDGVAPELRARVLRVIERMQAEHGHTVDVVEGRRSQARQDHLWAQGRTRPGPVVTWTRTSLHTRGRAVDVQVDGTWDDPKAYARLQHIAREEGLGTLGMRDPGHLELRDPEAPARASAGDRTARAGGEGARGPAVARPARVARVASPGPVATPARVASPGPVAAPAPVAAVARPGRTVPSGGTTRGEGSGAAAAAGGDRPLVATSPDAPAPGGPAHSAARAGRTSPAESGERRDAGPRPADAEPAGTGGAGAERRAADDGFGRRALGEGGPSVQGVAGAPSAPAGAEAPSGVEGPDAAARVDRVEALREAQRAGPARVRVDVPDLDGAGTRLRMSLRGERLMATLDVDDGLMADRMRARVDELHRALERQGLTADALRVRAPDGAPDGGSTAQRSGGEDAPWRGREQAREKEDRHPAGHGGRQDGRSGSDSGTEDGR